MKGLVSSLALEFAQIDWRDPAQAKRGIHLMTAALISKGHSRAVARRQARDWAKLRANEAPTAMHRLGSSMIEVLAAMRAMPMSPTHDDSVDEIIHRRLRNQRKRARRERRTR